MYIHKHADCCCIDGVQAVLLHSLQATFKNEHQTLIRNSLGSRAFESIVFIEN